MRSNRPPGMGQTGAMQAADTNLDAWLADAARRLGDRLEAEILAGHVLGHGRAWLYAHREHVPESAQVLRLDELLARRLAGEPIAYLLGVREFWGREFRVGPEVLIPRPETELLVEAALALNLPADARVLDVGTGSGCLALTLAAERPVWTVTATDLSADALAVARVNRELLGLADVELLHGDLYAPVTGRPFDLVVSNPPYVADADSHLERGDVRFEPHLALAAGRNGLAVIRRIVDGAPAVLSPGGRLLLEHGHDQADPVRGLLESGGFVDVRSLPDLAGIARAVSGRIPETVR